MTTHIWNDDWPYWDDLYKAENYIYAYVKRWSRCTLISKEKYGTIRYEWVFPPNTVRGVRSKFRRWWVDRSWIQQKWRQYGYWILKKAIYSAVRKWPHLKDELFEDSPFDEQSGPYWTKVTSQADI